ncbi:isocitrate lyase/PEP mutase family protein [Paucibacter soli]|uniref:isocitrate lyase/PEP mutase family protein n=1 Tax=Paucibacter soli TaxID=3133433 RepID=UPI00309EF287
MTAFQTFHALHQGPAPLLLPNAWDAASARLFELAGAPAIATSSAALAWSLGYADGGALPPEELLAAVRRIARVIRLPLTVDLEDGYSTDPATVAALAGALADAGAAGINLEDGAGAPALLAEKIAAIRAALGGRRSLLFVNARCDVWLRQLAKGEAAVAMALERLRLYREAGADGGFAPGLCDTEEVRALAPAIGMPLNLMMLPGMPAIAELHAAGARRFSVGPAPFLAAYGQAQVLMGGFVQAQATADLFGQALNYAAMDLALQR